MRTVLVFGAGASIAAGYPPTATLLEAIERWATSTPVVGPADQWSNWIAFRDSEQNGLLRLLLNAPNPEIALSALDLFTEAQEDYLRAQWNAAIEALRKRSAAAYAAAKSRIEPFLDAARASNAARARAGLLSCLERFLIHKSWDEADSPQSRTYLRRLFGRLQDGDVVVSLNWDSAAERTLGEMGLWNPTTGYGFRKPLRREPPNAPAPGELEVIPSAVTVLKLHGSVGWKRPWHQLSPICFDDAYLLNHLPVKIMDGEEPARFSDPQFERLTHEDPVIVPPTFLKAMPAGQEIQQLWYSASRALDRADRVEIFGYSLPPSDAAARVLLNPLRFRVSEGTVEVTVTDPSAETRARWNDFIGAEVGRDGVLA